MVEGDEGMSDALEMAVFFHETYERLAPSFGYATREDTKQFDPSSNNGRLMQAVCAAWIEQRDARIRELEEEIDRLKTAYAALRDGREAHITKLEAQIAAHEKVCAGVWVDVKERLPSGEPAFYWCVIAHENGEMQKGEVWFNGELWNVWGCVVTHWLDAKQPDEGVES